MKEPCINFFTLVPSGLKKAFTALRRLFKINSYLFNTLQADGALGKRASWGAAGVPATRAVTSLDAHASFLFLLCLNS
jgi:hypothetical protein